MLHKFKELILKNYLNKIEERMIDNEIVVGIVDGADFLSLDNPIYQERILFNLGPKEVICGHSLQVIEMLKFEHQVYNKNNNQNRSDAVFLARDGKKNKIMSIFENKIADSLNADVFESQKNKVLREVIEKYLIPYFNNNQLLIEDIKGQKDNKKPIIHLSLMFYNPEIYLQGKKQMIYYLNNPHKKDATKLLKETGFFCFNLTLSAKDIVLLIKDYEDGHKREVLFILKEYYKQQKKIELLDRKISHNFPTIFIIKGNIKRGPWATDTNYSFDCKLPQLYNIPLWNITPDSKINNTRDLSKENLSKQFKEISDTFCHNYYQKQQKVTLNEIYIGTGAKAREISYDFFKTVVFNLRLEDYKIDDWQHNMDNEIMYVSCDMASIDGQHSTTTILDILNMLANKSELMSEEGVKFNPASRIFERLMKKNGLEVDSVVKKEIEKFLLNEQLIEINIKGFENPNLANRNAKNQNNISEHSKFEKIFNSYKSLFKILAVSFNSYQKDKQIKTYIPITKDAFSLPSFKDIKSKYESLDINYFISLASVLETKVKNNKNSYFSANFSSANINSNWEKAKNFYFETSEFLNILYKLLTIKNDFKENENINSKSNHLDFCSEIIKHLNKELKTHNNSLNDLEKLKLDSIINGFTILKNVIPTTDDESNIEDQINNQYKKIEDEIGKISIVKKENMIFIGNFIYSFLVNCPKNNFKNLFSSELKFKTYSLIYLLSLLREKYSISDLIKIFPEVNSFKTFFNNVDKHIEHEVNNVFGIENELGEKIIKESLEIGGTEKNEDNIIIKKLFEYKFIDN